MKLPVPLLRKNGPVHYPDGIGMDKCPFCDTPFSESDGIASFNAGVMWGNEDRGFSQRGPGVPSAFWFMTFLGRISDENEASLEIVQELQRNQFEVCFCSLKSMRGWLNELIDELERQHREYNSR